MSTQPFLPHAFAARSAASIALPSLTLPISLALRVERFRNQEDESAIFPENLEEAETVQNDQANCWYKFNTSLLKRTQSASSAFSAPDCSVHHRGYLHAGNNNSRCAQEFPHRRSLLSSRTPRPSRPSISHRTFSSSNVPSLFPKLPPSLPNTASSKPRLPPASNLPRSQPSNPTFSKLPSTVPRPSARTSGLQRSVRGGTSLEEDALSESAEIIDPLEYKLKVDRRAKARRDRFQRLETRVNDLVHELQHSGLYTKEWIDTEVVRTGQFAKDQWFINRRRKLAERVESWALSLERGFLTPVEVNLQTTVSFLFGEILGLKSDEAKKPLGQSLPALRKALQTHWELRAIAARREREKCYVARAEQLAQIKDDNPEGDQAKQRLHAREISHLAEDLSDGIFNFLLQLAHGRGIQGGDLKSIQLLTESKYHSKALKGLVLLRLSITETATDIKAISHCWRHFNAASSLVDFDANMFYHYGKFSPVYVLNAELRSNARHILNHIQFLLRFSTIRYHFTISAKEHIINDATQLSLSAGSIALLTSIAFQTGYLQKRPTSLVDVLPLWENQRRDFWPIDNYTIRYGHVKLLLRGFATEKSSKPWTTGKLLQKKILSSLANGEGINRALYRAHWDFLYWSWLNYKTSDKATAPSQEQQAMMIDSDTAKALIDIPSPQFSLGTESRPISPSLSYNDFRGPHGEIPSVSYVTTAQFAATILRRFASHKVVGLDILGASGNEKFPRHPRSQLQAIVLANEREIAIFHIALLFEINFICDFLYAMQLLLESRDITKVGVNMTRHARLLSSCAGIYMDGYVNLGNDKMPTNVSVEGTSIKPATDVLSELVFHRYGKPLSLSKSPQDITIYGLQTLSHIQHLASRAYAAFHLFHAPQEKDDDRSQLLPLTVKASEIENGSIQRVGGAQPIAKFETDPGPIHIDPDFFPPNQLILSSFPKNRLTREACLRITSENLAMDYLKREKYFSLYASSAKSQAAQTYKEKLRRHKQKLQACYLRIVFGEHPEDYGLSSDYTASEVLRLADHYKLTVSPERLKELEAQRARELETDPREQAEKWLESLYKSTPGSSPALLVRPFVLKRTAERLAKLNRRNFLLTFAMWHHTDMTVAEIAVRLSITDMEVYTDIVTVVEQQLLKPVQVKMQKLRETYTPTKSAGRKMIARKDDNYPMFASYRNKDSELNLKVTESEAKVGVRETLLHQPPGQTKLVEINDTAPPLDNGADLRTKSMSRRPQIPAADELQMDPASLETWQPMKDRISKNLEPSTVAARSSKVHVSATFSGSAVESTHGAEENVAATRRIQYSTQNVRQAKSRAPSLTIKGTTMANRKRKSRVETKIGKTRVLPTATIENQSKKYGGDLSFRKVDIQPIYRSRSSGRNLGMVRTPRISGTPAGPGNGHKGKKSLARTASRRVVSLNVHRPVRHVQIDSGPSDMLFSHQSAMARERVPAPAPESTLTPN